MRARLCQQGRKSTGVLTALVTLAWLVHVASAATILRPLPATADIRPADEVIAPSHRLRAASSRLLAGSSNGFSRNSRSLQGTVVQGLVLQGTHLNGLRMNGIRINGLRMNGIGMNGLRLNGIRINGLRMNGIDESSLNETSLSNVTVGTISNTTTAFNGTAEYLINSALLPAVNGSSDSSTLLREFIKYAVQCALPPTTTIAVPWVDDQGVSHVDLNRGVLNLAPAWQTGPLDLKGQLWVSACLAAHTNYYGSHVNISLRGGIEALQSNTPKEEIDAFTYQEGAFWGNLFTDPPTLFACYNSTNVDHSRGLMRDCAAGHVDESSGEVVDCGIITRVGKCDAVCGRPKPPDMHYGRCGSGDNKSYKVVTVYLQ